MFDEEISISRPLFEYDISILVVWVNHLINLRYNFIISKILKNQRSKIKQRKQSKKEESLEVLSWGSRYVLSSYGPGLLRVPSFIFMGRCVCVEGLCVTWLLPVGIRE